MIPKKIFYVWGAGEKKKRDVQVCIQTWRQYMPNYEIIEINQDRIDYFNFQKELAENKWFRTIYKRKIWAYIADYIRIKTLYNNGGIYLDTDVSAVKTLDMFLNNQAFTGIQDSSQDGNSDWVEPAILGAEAKNPFFKQILDFYSENGKNTIWTMPIYTIPEIFKYILEKEYGIQKYPAKPNQKIIQYDNITLYPEKYFVPFRFGYEFSPDCVVDETCTIHWFGGSWTNNAGTLDFLSNKHNTKILNIIIRKCLRLFIFLKIINTRKLNNTDKCLMLFNFLPLLAVSKKADKTIYKLFGIFPYTKYI